MSVLGLRSNPPRLERAQSSSEGGMPYLRLLIVIFFMQLETFTYMIVNWFGCRLRQVNLLTPEDTQQPLRPRSLWVYLSLLQYCLMMVFEFRSYRQLYRIFVCLGLNSLVSYRAFLRFPSAYPRPSTPTPDDARLSQSWQALHKMDRPANTFPSLHVGHVYLLALLVADEQSREKTDSHLLWATAIAISTITTKQHYLVDITGGLLLAEQIASQIYEPWNRGELSFRAAVRSVRAMNAHLDELAANPRRFQLSDTERHPRIAEFLARYRRHGSVSSFFAAAEPAFLFERQRQLLAMLLELRSYVSALNFITPGLLQFIQDMENAAPHINEGGTYTYLRELDEDMQRVMSLIFAVPARNQPFCSPAAQDLEVLTEMTAQQGN
jgi:hypothetical protein